MTGSEQRREIERRLGQIEEGEQVRILLAVESGSRAWGFASADSDYDVRFIYVRPPEWYWSIDLERRRDVIEPPIDSVFDINGWDLRKALNLLRKCNPPLLEWLNSPIIYRADEVAAERLRALVPHCYSVPNLMYHYHRMALKTAHKHLRREQVLHKKYFYALRPLLAIRWLEWRAEPVPMTFPELLEAAHLSRPLAKAITKLLAARKAGAESEAGPRIPEISEFIETELDRLKTVPIEKRPSLPDIEPLNEYFRWATT